MRTLGLPPNPHFGTQNTELRQKVLGVTNNLNTFTKSHLKIFSCSKFKEGWGVLNNVCKLISSYMQQQVVQTNDKLKHQVIYMQ